ncbi:MAG TPA: response regulator [Acidobacteriaceae bacterium]|jgi:DNA-binding response OmpR family regulator|nr:response regulator [Acidobacteriaceae bacterium]
MASDLPHFPDPQSLWSHNAMQPSSDSGSLRIYIVDDEWIIAETLATILNKGGFNSYPFHNSSQALVRAMDCPPDVLITDVMMPGMTGIELAIALRRAGHNCRILLFSGQSGALDLLCDARRRGYEFELLEKPLHPLQLLMRLRNMKRHPSPVGPTPPEESDSPPETGTGSIPAA